MKLPDRITDIVWLQTAFIGDIVLTTAAFALAFERFPGARQHLVTTKVGAVALAGHPHLASTVVFEKGRAGLLASFRAVRTTLGKNLADPRGAVLVSAHRSHRSSLLGRYLRLPTINYREAAWGGFATARVPRLAVVHETLRLALLLEPLGVPREAIMAARPFLPQAALAPDSELARLLRLDDPSLVRIGISPGSQWRTKEWPAESYRALARALLDHDPRYLIILLGAASEGALVSVVKAGLPPERVVDTIGKAPLKVLNAVFPTLAVHIGNDSSPLQFASALDTPTVALFGPTTPQMGFGPLARHSRVAEVSGLACRPCSDHGPNVCPLGHFKCMRELTPAAVLEATLAVLAARPALTVDNAKAPDPFPSPP